MNLSAKITSGSVTSEPGFSVHSVVWSVQLSGWSGWSVSWSVCPGSSVASFQNKNYTEKNNEVFVFFKYNLAKIIFLKNFIKHLFL